MQAAVNRSFNQITVRYILVYVLSNLTGLAAQTSDRQPVSQLVKFTIKSKYLLLTTENNLIEISVKFEIWKLKWDNRPLTSLF